MDIKEPSDPTNKEIELLLKPSEPEWTATSGGEDDDDSSANGKGYQGLPTPEETPTPDEDSEQPAPDEDLK